LSSFATVSFHVRDARVVPPMRDIPLARASSLARAAEE
jgi:hypothetical protein